MSNIEWTQKTWNPTTGCTKVSAECKFCYAEKGTNRLKHNTTYSKYKEGFKNVVMHPETLKDPYKWIQPATIFVNSMSDLFHEDIPLSFIQEVFKVMNETPWHTYQILTKRELLLEKYSDKLTWTDNIWMGVSVGEQQAVKRIKPLVKCGATHKFLSIEPLIEEINDLDLDGINWVIVGGESGNNKVRTLKKEWVLKIQKQCADQSVPFFFKQWGKSRNNPNQNDPTINKTHLYYAKGGCELDGKVYRANPSIIDSDLPSIDIFGKNHLIMDKIENLVTIWDLKSYLPPTEEILYESLKEDIKKNGLINPILYITTVNNQKLVVDGHARLKALISLKKGNIYAKEIEQSFNCMDDLKLWITRNQLGRRNLSKFERVRLAYNSRPIIEKLAKANLSFAGKSFSKNRNAVLDTTKIVKVDTYQQIADIANIGRTMVYQYSQILQKSSKKVLDQLNREEITISKAFKLLKNTCEDTTENADKRFISIMPNRNNEQSVADSRKKEHAQASKNKPKYKDKEVTEEDKNDFSCTEKKEDTFTDNIIEIKDERTKSTPTINITLLNTIDEGKEKISKNEIDVIMIFNKSDKLDLLTSSLSARIGVYYLN